jgi:tetratricopeptide (TPR) repeat protein
MTKFLGSWKMFLSIAGIVGAVMIYVTIRYWLRRAHLGSYRIKETLNEVRRHIALEEWDLASSKLIPLLENKQGGKKAELFHIQILRNQNCLKKALSKVQAASKIFPEELLFRLEEGKILLELNEAKEALETLNVCTPIFRFEGDFQAYGRALLETGYPEKCLEVIAPWLERNQAGQLYALAAKAHFALHAFNEAILWGEKAVKQKYRPHSMMILLGNAYRRNGNLTSAQHLFRSLVDKDSMDIAALMGLGECLQERKEFTKALLIYQSSKAWEHQDARLLYEAGICALKSGRYAQAHSYFAIVLEKQQVHTPKLLAYFGFCLEKQEKWSEAEYHYRTLLHLFPNDPQGYLALAWMFGVGKTTALEDEEGMLFAERALALHQSKMSLEILSACLSRVGEFERAYEIHRKLSVHDKESHERVRRAQVMRQLRKQTPLNTTLITHSLVA